MTMPTLRIHHWRNTIQVPRDSPSPHRLRDRIDALVEHLPDRLEAGLAPLFADAGDPVLLIRQLSFTCALDLSRDPESLVTTWALCFAKALSAAMDSASSEVWRFPSLAAFHARYITDRARGLASTTWYHRTFSGLVHLSPAAAIRTLLLEDPALGRATLVELPAQVWAGLATVMSRPELQRILEGLVVAGGDPADLASLVQLYRAEAAQIPAGSWPMVALFLVTAALRAGLPPTDEVVQWIRLAARLPQLASGALASDGPSLGEALRTGNVEALIAADPQQEQQSWQALGDRPGWGAALAALLEPTAEPPAAPGGGSLAEPVSTAFGGLVLLLPELNDLLDDNLCALLPEWRGGPARNLLAWLALGLCVGSSQRGRFLNESLWRDFFALPPSLDYEEISDWLVPAAAAPAAGGLAQQAATLARGDSVVVPLRIEDQRHRLAVDGASGLWLALDPDSRQTPTSWRACLAAARGARRDWLHLRADWGLPEPWLCLLIQMAQVAMRRFAYRIPGMAGASLPYLCERFLAGGGSFDARSNRLELRRPPLYVLLNLCGASRRRIRWSGPPERQLVLEYEP